MPSVFDQHFAAAGFPMLLSQFGEAVVYRKRCGEVREVQAIVEREPPAIYNASGNAVMPRAIVRVYNSHRSGIESREVDTGGDEVEFALNIEDLQAKRFSVMQMQSQDSGVTVLAVM